MLERAGSGADCPVCEVHYDGVAPSQRLDLRLQRPKTYPYEFKLGTPLFTGESPAFVVLENNPHPEVDFSGCDVPHHLTRKVLSHFPKAKGGEALALDLGCGDAVHREVCQHAGYEYVGLDYSCEDAPMLGDAHALPFADASFDFVLSIAVLEHIRYPFVMMKETHRVLKPGGSFIGTVAFLEPFHGDSFYHHTHLGAYNSLREGGFEVRHIAPDDHWTALRAQASMALFPLMPKAVAHAVVAPIEALHRAWWALGDILSPKATRASRVTRLTGAFTFIAVK